MVLLNNKKINLILLFSSFGCFLLFALLGIGNIGYDSWGWLSSEPMTLYNCLGVIFVPIIALLYLILIPLTLLFFFGKLRFIRVHKFMSAFDFLGVFGVSLAQGILIMCYCRMPLSPLGNFVNILIILTMILSMASSILCLINLFSMPKYISHKKAKAIEKKQSENAAQKLKTLKSLFDQGIISKEEYDEKKKKYIELL